MMHDAFTTLMLNHPWYSIGLRLRLEADADAKRTPTTTVNGTVLRYNPEYITSLTRDEVQGTLAQAVMKCSLGHPWRQGNRTARRWNRSCDYTVNQILTEDGLILPDSPTKNVPAEYRNKSAEQIYAAEPEDENDDNQHGSQPGSNQVEPPETGDGDQDGDNSDQDGQGDATEAEWQEMAAQQSMLAKKAGKMSEDIDRAIRDARQTRTPWQTILKEWVERTCPKDYTWSRSSRHSNYDEGLYLPGIQKENTGRLAILVDTSGSVSQEMLAEFSREITTILQETEPEYIDVVYCDTSVKGWETFTPEDGKVTLHAKGGGGTAFSPALAWLKERMETEPYIGAMYLTDLYGHTADLEEPGVPFLWCVTEGSDQVGPWGQTVRFEQSY
jgi:predicted metal-dependent peptidase